MFTKWHPHGNHMKTKHTAIQYEPYQFRHNTGTGRSNASHIYKGEEHMKNKNTKIADHNLTVTSGLDSATGPVTIPMHNDYLFRALLQRNNRVLKGLICSLLHLNDKQIRTVSITNPIELGETIDNKTFFLDVKVLMNDQTYINLEMQVINEHDWVERSLSYLCRSFNNLEHGQDYVDVKPACSSPA